MVAAVEFVVLAPQVVQEKNAVIMVAAVLAVIAAATPLVLVVLVCVTPAMLIVMVIMPVSVIPAPIIALVLVVLLIPVRLLLILPGALAILAPILKPERF